MKKNILIIQQGLKGGGAEKVLVDIINNFDYSRFEILLLLIDRDGVYNDQINEKTKVKYLLSPKAQYILGYLQKARLWSLVDSFYKYRLRKVLGKQNFDTCISFMEGVSTRCHSFLLDISKKNVSWVHIDMLLNNWCLSSFKSFDEQKWIYNQMDQIVTVSDGAKKSFVKLFPETKPRVVYNLIDKKQIIEKASSETHKSKKFTVCNVGRLANQKRQDRIIEVALICKTNSINIDFIILGEGPLYDDLIASIQEKKLQDYVHLLGFQRNPYSYIASSDVFFMTSDSEGYPLVLCEALCLGKPIVSTDVTGPHELLKDGSGILTSNAPFDLYNAIYSLYSDKQLLKVYSERALAKSAIFDVPSQMSDIYSIL